MADPQNPFGGGGIAEIHQRPLIELGGGGGVVYIAIVIKNKILNGKTTKLNSC